MAGGLYHRRMVQICCHETHHARDSTLPTHRHRAAYAALVVEGGHVETSLDGPRRCERGMLVLHPHFHAHGNRFSSGGARVLNLPLPAFYGGRSRVLRVHDLGEAQEVFQRDPVRLAALLAEAREVSDADVPLPDWQSAFAAALRDRDDAIGTIARELGVSAAHASRALAASHGLPPQRLRREARWQLALRLLHGDTPLSQVAAIAGFTDQSHFTRLCTAQTGMPPAALRRRIKCVQDPRPDGMAH